MSAIPQLDQLIESWILDGHRPIGNNGNGSSSDDISYIELMRQLEFFGDKFFCRFIPALFPPHNPDFKERLRNWLTNEGLTPEDQRTLFEFALRLAFFSFEDFVQLYRSAFTGPIARWIIDELRLSLVDKNFDSRLEEERRRHTWYCPITDSMVISEFYHANGITGIDQRPAFRALKEFGDAVDLKRYMSSRNLTRLVLLEDFVGTGTQTNNTINWAASVLTCPILVVPLVICPDGLEALLNLTNTYAGRVRVEPVLRLDEQTFVKAHGGVSDPLLAKIEQLAVSVHPKVMGSPDKTYGPFGFSLPTDKNKGATVVLFSNTPDNTLPLVHHHAQKPSKWQALFPRVAREIT